MKTLFLCFFLFIIISLAGCSNDNTTNPSVSINGKWEGKAVAAINPITYEAIFDIVQTGTIISGTGTLKIITLGETTDYTSMITGEYNNPDIELTIIGGGGYGYKGKVDSEGKIINGNITLDGTNNINMELKKK